MMASILSGRNATGGAGAGRLAVRVLVPRLPEGGGGGAAAGAARLPSP